ncbi:protein SYS1 homolog [Tribolium castaneum]|uniref:Protein SYS1 homolog n=1 Tax=Tribolium castaneum TaxID=7070 RepID=D6WSS9_TRICA|nr:PREDICTED: protein SYS1 homolog [Tribolium castaneum]EFA07645.2 Protein SYS1 homolog-like Protein [Tribolium castaneum]|eukprot:XP_973996.1 PREDICTED: protein SYS1 homolog [Tribolium castaneum]
MKKLSGSFRYTQWDPWLLIAQIISVQCIIYVSLGLILTVLGVIVGDTRSLDHIFEYHEIQVRDFGGRMVIAAFVLNAFVGAVTLWYVVERTKQCMDFSCTWHFFHLLICWWYNGNFPTTFSWWALNVACATLMCVCAEFLCLRTELKAIPLSLGPKTDL